MKKNPRKKTQNPGKRAKASKRRTLGELITVLAQHHPKKRDVLALGKFLSGLPA